MCKINILRIAAASLIVFLSLTSVAMAQHVWHSYNGHVYSLTLGWKPWLEAEAEANALGGHLVTINDENENLWLATTFAGTYAHGFYGDPLYAGALIGYYHDGDDWGWISGEPVTYTNYWVDFPEGGTHSYLHVNPHPYGPTWNAAPWHTEYGADPNDLTKGIIELPVPDPPTTPLITTLTCNPSSGTLPFATRLRVTIFNLHNDVVRRISGRIDVTLASGQSFPNWRAGNTNVAPGDSFFTSWNQSLPAVGSLIGSNAFTLIVEDVTPSPYNQPPYPPAGDTDSDICLVTGVAP